MAASITVNLNDEDEAILIKLTNEGNANPGAEQLSPAQFLRNYVRDWIRSHASRFFEQDQLGMRSAYKKATTAEKTTIDTILNQYR